MGLYAQGHCIYLQLGSHSEGPGQTQEMGLCELHEVLQGQVQCPAHGSGQPPLSVQSGE